MEFYWYFIICVIILVAIVAFRHKHINMKTGTEMYNELQETKIKDK